MESVRTASLKFIVTVVGITIACALLQFLWNSRMPQHLKLESGFWLLGIFAASVTVIHFLLLNSIAGKPQRFVTNFMGITALKFFGYIGILLLFLFFTKENKQALVLHFLFYYVVFTILEVTMLYSHLKKAN